MFVRKGNEKMGQLSLNFWLNLFGKILEVDWSNLQTD